MNVSAYKLKIPTSQIRAMRITARLLFLFINTTINSRKRTQALKRCFFACRASQLPLSNTNALPYPPVKPKTRPLHHNNELNRSRRYRPRIFGFCPSKAERSLVCDTLKVGCDVTHSKPISICGGARSSAFQFEQSTCCVFFSDLIECLCVRVVVV